MKILKSSPDGQPQGASAPVAEGIQSSPDATPDHSGARTLFDGVREVPGDSSGTAGGDSAQTPPATSGHAEPEDGDGESLWWANVSGDLVDDHLKSFKTHDDFVKAYKETKSFVGRKGLAYPGDDAGEAEREAYFKSIGRPDTPDGYQGIDDEALRGAFHEAGLSPVQAKAVAGKYAEWVSALEQQAETEALDARIGCERALREKWGAMFDENIGMALKSIKGSPLEQKISDPKYSLIFNDPDFVELLHDVGRAKSEDGFVTGEVSVQNIDAELERIERSPIRNDPMNPQYRAMQDRWLKLLEIKSRQRRE